MGFFGLSGKGQNSSNNNLEKSFIGILVKKANETFISLSIYLSFNAIPKRIKITSSQ